MSQPIIPQLEPVFSIRADIGAALSGGKGVLGERLHIPILGGTVSGPRLNGTILPGGSDWPLITPDGNSHVTAHYTVQADDGTLIYVFNKGMRVSSPAVLARLRAGEQVDPAEHYFRTVPTFDVTDGPHQWLRENIFVGSALPHGPMVQIDIYQVT